MINSPAPAPSPIIIKPTEILTETELDINSLNQELSDDIQNEINNLSNDFTKELTDIIPEKKETIIESLKEENKPAWWKTTYGIILISLVFFIILVLVLRYKILFDITKLFLIMV
tara:strand:+ start:94 stop:438 length:345 start_codon:yes stop_codon:yes gene_type:complete